MQSFVRTETKKKKLRQFENFLIELPSVYRRLIFHALRSFPVNFNSIYFQVAEEGHSWMVDGASCQTYVLNSPVKKQLENDGGKTPGIDMHHLFSS